MSIRSLRDKRALPKAKGDLWLPGSFNAQSQPNLEVTASPAETSGVSMDFVKTEFTWLHGQMKSGNKRVKENRISSKKDSHRTAWASELPPSMCYLRRAHLSTQAENGKTWVLRSTNEAWVTLERMRII